MPGIDSRVSVGRLRWRGDGVDPLSARLRLEHVLGGMALPAAGLPPSAVVCVRQLRDPRPGRLSLRRDMLRPPADWEQALSASLRDVLRRAIRPALDAVTGEAEAVLFADLAELLSCLASDLGTGLASERWWWRGLYKERDLHRVLVTEWCRAPEHVPPAMEFLVMRGQVEAVARSLGDSSARLLLANLGQRFGWRAQGAREEGDVEGPQAGHTESSRPPPLPGGLEPEAPWLSWAPELERVSVSMDWRQLLSAALLVRRAPSLALQPSTWRTMREWRQQESPLRTAPPSQLAEPAKSSVPQARDARPDSDPPALVEEAALSPVARAQQEDSTVSAPSTARPRPVLTWAAPSEAPQASTRKTQHSVAQDGAAMHPGALSLGGVLDGPANASVVPASAAVDSPTPSAVPPPPPDAEPAAPVAASRSPHASAPFVSEPSVSLLPIPTQLGGLFFLASVGLSLELYGDFTRPLANNLPLALWDFIALLGRRLLVDERRSDPVWKLLAMLSGRKPGEAPGHCFTPSGAWRLPPAWLRAFPEEEPWTWDTLGGRLRVRHPAWFPVIDVPLDGNDAEAQLRRETEAYGPVSLVPEALPLDVHVTTPLERWLGWLTPYVRARLVRSLGPETNEPAELERTLLALEARVHVTAGNVDVLFPLAQLPLPVRMAGLDRDIGWVPAAGRGLLFHFE